MRGGPPKKGLGRGGGRGRSSFDGNMSWTNQHAHLDGRGNPSKPSVQTANQPGKPKQAPQKTEEQRKEENQTYRDNVGNDAIRDAAAVDAEVSDQELYAQYKPKKIPEGETVQHPDPVIETRTLAHTIPPDIWYKHHLQDACREGTLSSLQLETVIYANQRFQRRLEDGARKGFFLGDGAGVGKGRQVAALVYEHLRTGGSRAIWLSVSPDLRYDARRDMQDLNIEPGLKVFPEGTRSLPSAESDLDSAVHGMDQGVLFMTYSTLIRSTQSVNKSLDTIGAIEKETAEKAASKGTRLGQAAKWLKGDSDGSPLIILDECHKAKNVMFNDKGSTKTANAVMALQKLIPDAKVVYCSATGVSEPKNLGYMLRIGVFGFENQGQLIQSLINTGLGALEAFAMGLKAIGAYVSRTLSYEGAEFSVVRASLSSEFKIMYDRAAEFWQLLMHVFQFVDDNRAQSPNKRNKRGLGRLMWGMHQRFFRQLLLAAKVPELAKHGRWAVDHEGQAVVIGLQSTGDANVAQAMAERTEEREDFVSAPHMVLRNFIKKHLVSLDDAEQESKRRNVNIWRNFYYHIKRHVDQWRQTRVVAEESIPQRGAEEGEENVKANAGTNAEEEEEEIEIVAHKTFEEVEKERTERAKRTGNFVDLSAIITDEEAAEIDRKYTQNDEMSRQLAERRRREERERIDRERAEVERSTLRENEQPMRAAEEPESNGEGMGGERDREGNKPGYLKGRGMKRIAENGREEFGRASKFDPETEMYLVSIQGEEQLKRLWLTSDELKNCALEEENEEHSEQQQQQQQQQQQKQHIANGSMYANDEGATRPSLPAKDVKPDMTSTVKRRKLDDETDAIRAGAEESGMAQAIDDDEDFDFDLGSGNDEGNGDPADEEDDGDGCETEQMWLRKVQKVLLEGVDALELPPNPLDHIIDLMGGPKAVAEMTGRDEHFERQENGMLDRRQRRPEEARARVNIAERNDFMQGVKNIAIISEAGSTGVSLHADKRYSNTRRRCHMTLELPWSADKAVQQMGRSHRSNQSCAPLYKLVVTRIGGERRFASAAAKRLQSLGAILKGDRHAVGAGNELREFDIDNKHGARALHEVFSALAHPTRALKPGVSFPTVDASLPASHRRAFRPFACSAFESVGLALAEPPHLSEKQKIQLPERSKMAVDKFLNRLLGLAVEEQRALFDFLMQNFEAVVTEAKTDGKFDNGIVELKEESVAVEQGPFEIHQDDDSGASTSLVRLKCDLGMSYANACAELESFAREVEQQGGSNDTSNLSTTSWANGFWVSKRVRNAAQTGQPWVLLATQIKGASTNTQWFRTRRPNKANHPRRWELAELKNSYVKVTPEDAKGAWETLHEHFMEGCIHGPECALKQDGMECRAGCRREINSVIAGAILPVWKAVNDAVHNSFEGEKNAKVIKAETDHSQHLVGLHVPEKIVNQVMEAIDDLEGDGADQADERGRQGANSNPPEGVGNRGTNEVEEEAGRPTNSRDGSLASTKPAGEGAAPSQKSVEVIEID